MVTAAPAMPAFESWLKVRPAIRTPGVGASAGVKTGPFDGYVGESHAPVSAATRGSQRNARDGNRAWSLITPSNHKPRCRYTRKNTPVQSAREGSIRAIPNGDAPAFPYPPDLWHRV